MNPSHFLKSQDPVSQGLEKLTGSSQLARITRFVNHYMQGGCFCGKVFQIKPSDTHSHSHNLPLEIETGVLRSKFVVRIGGILLPI